MVKTASWRRGWGEGQQMVISNGVNIYEIFYFPLFFQETSIAKSDQTTWENSNTILGVSYNESRFVFGKFLLQADVKEFFLKKRYRGQGKHN